MLEGRGKIFEWFYNTFGRNIEILTQILVMLHANHQFFL